MNFTTDTYNTIDGKTIFYYKWPSNKNTTLKGIVQISHGVGEHAGRYKPIARILQDEGYEVYANDHRIHGKSAKSDAFLGFYDGNNYFSDAINDMRQLSEIIKKEHPNKKIILLTFAYKEKLCALNFVYNKKVSAVADSLCTVYKNAFNEHA